MRDNTIEKIDLKTLQLNPEILHLATLFVHILQSSKFQNTRNYTELSNDIFLR